MAHITVSDTEPRVQYTASASQTVFSVPFPFFLDASLKVYKTPTGSTADDSTDILALSTDYTVVGSGNVAGVTREITLLVAATAGDTVTIIRDEPVERSSDYQNNGDLLAATLNDEQDKEVMIMQQLETRLDRVPELANTETDGSGAYDANSNRIKNLGTATANTDAVPKTQVESLAESIADLAVLNSAIGASTSWTPPGTGAVARTVSSKLGDIVSVYDFGAAGDDSTDDAAAIQAAIDHCELNSLTLEIPAATYRIASTITVLSCNIIGWGAVLSADATVSIGVQVGDSSNIYEGQISGLAVSGQGKGSQPANSYAWKLVNCSQAMFDSIQGSSFPRNLGVIPEDGTRIAYCTFMHPYMHRGDYNVYILVDTTTGYAAENTVFGGRLQMTSTQEVTNHVYAERTSGSGSINHWQWYGQSMESRTGAVVPTMAIRLQNVTYWHIEQPRTEGDWVTADIQFDANSSYNRVITDYADASFSISDLNGLNVLQYHNRWMAGGQPLYVQRNFSTVNEITPGSTDVAVFHRAGGAQIKVIAATGSTPKVVLGTEADNDITSFAASTASGIIQVNGVSEFEVTGAATRPYTNNVRSLGDGTNRWTEVYATNGTINTSDARLKKDIEYLSDVEMRVAHKLKRLVRKFRWAESEDETIHFGVIAQDVEQAFKDEGLWVDDYALFIRTEIDEDGETFEQLGIRYTELLAFIIAAI